MKKLLPLLVITLAGCAQLGGTPESTAPEALSGTWNVVSVNDEPVLSAPNLTFAGGEFTGTDGCNRVFGSYEYVDGTLTSQGASTRRACEPEVMKQASVVNRLLQSATISQEDDVLLLTAEEEQIRLSQ